MALEDIVPDDAGEAKGGRPPENRDKEREVRGDPFLPEKDTEEWWSEIYGEFVEGNSPTTEEITRISDYVALRPDVVKRKLKHHGVHEFLFEDIAKSHPSQLPVDKLRRELTGEGVPGRSKKDDKKDSKESSGLMGLVEDAKREE